MSKLIRQKNTTRQIEVGEHVEHFGVAILIERRSGETDHFEIAMRVSVGNCQLLNARCVKAAHVANVNLSNNKIDDNII